MPTSSDRLRPQTRPTAISAGLVLGIGLGGFIDGIVLHQIVQWHSMGSAILPPHSMQAMSTNMRWDGLFHLVTLAITFAGILLLRHEGRIGRTPPLKFLLGQMLLGWGLFNLVEGVIDHHLLELHHVRDVPVHVPAYDWIFLAVGGVLFIVTGWAISRR